MSVLRFRQAWSIGFNDSVDVEGRGLHVQTEVLMRNGAAIRTTVLAGGVAKYAKTEPVPPNVLDMEALEARVRAQHQGILDHLKRAGASWLESI
jgi:hypothetical protein